MKDFFMRLVYLLGMKDFIESSRKRKAYQSNQKKALRGALTKKFPKLSKADTKVVNYLIKIAYDEKYSRRRIISTMDIEPGLSIKLPCQYKGCAAHSSLYTAKTTAELSKIWSQFTVWRKRHTESTHKEAKKKNYTSPKQYDMIKHLLRGILRTKMEGSLVLSCTQPFYEGLLDAFDKQKRTIKTTKLYTHQTLFFRFLLINKPVLDLFLDPKLESQPEFVSTWLFRKGETTREEDDKVWDSLQILQEYPMKVLISEEEFSKKQEVILNLIEKTIKSIKHKKVKAALSREFDLQDNLHELLGVD